VFFHPCLRIETYFSDVQFPELDPQQITITESYSKIKHQTYSNRDRGAGGAGGLQPPPPPIMLEKNFIVICKLLLVDPATSATAKRSFSMAKRVKTWLRANMKQQRFNNVALLHTHKARTDKIRLLDVANEFVQRNENRFRNFGKFSDLDLPKC